MQQVRKVTDFTRRLLCQGDSVSKAFPGALIQLRAFFQPAQVDGVALLAALGERLRARVGGGGRFTDGFVTASLLFCIGPMAIVGSIQNGLAFDARTLVLKSALDGIASVALAGVYGVGVGFSALPIVALQGGVSLAAAALARSLPDPATDPRVLLVSGAGGLLVAGIGVNLLLGGLAVEGRRIRVGADRLTPAYAAGLPDYPFRRRQDPDLPMGVARLPAWPGLPRDRCGEALRRHGVRHPLR